VDAPRADIGSLRKALLRRWLENSSRNDHARPVYDDRSLEAFADEVLDAATDCREDRFAENLVFIVDVWKAFARRRAGRHVDESGFKRRLVEANKNMLLSLQRADLIPAMDRERVAASTVHHMGGTFHFLRTDFKRHDS
jgi:hypothetical protein